MTALEAVHTRTLRARYGRGHRRLVESQIGDRDRARLPQGHALQSSVQGRILPVINALAASVVVLDAEGTIVAINNAWHNSLKSFGYSWAQCGVGSNFLANCNMAAASSSHAGRIAEGIAHIFAGVREPVEVRYCSEINGQAHELLMEISAFGFDGYDYAMVCVHQTGDTSARRHDDCSGMQHQFEIEVEERRRIAREIHDSTAQQMVAIGLLLARMEQINENAQVRGLIADANEAATEVLRELRSFSYLLHCPLGSERIAPALEGLVRGYAERTGLAFSFTCDLNGGEVRKELEVPLFRITQEALANARHHGGVSRVDVSLTVSSLTTELSVHDNGCGFDPAKVELGVGLASMRERAGAVGGILEVLSDNTGTQVRSCFIHH